VTFWLSIPLLALLTAAQASLAPSLQVAEARPQLVLVVVVCWAVVRGEGEALPWAIFGGLLLDLLSSLPPGSHVIALCAVAFLADLGHRFLHGGNNLFAVAAVLLGSVAYGALLMALAGYSPRNPQTLTALTSQVLPGALYNLVLMVPALALLRAYDRRYPRPVLPEF
jgi:rod shape-determining protein MreD